MPPDPWGNEIIGRPTRGIGIGCPANSTNPKTPPVYREQNMMGYPFIETPEGDVINLEQVTHFEIRKNIDPKWGHILWAFFTSTTFDSGSDTNSRTHGDCIAWGTEEHCQTVYEEIRTLLESNGKLYKIQAPESQLIEVEESEESSDEDPEPTPIPDWFRNLPQNEDAYQYDIVL